MRALHALAALAATVGVVAPAQADDGAADEAARREARALLREGNRLLQDARDPAGALSLFLAAYAKFPSAKIFLSIGSAERALGHPAAAANAYARFVAAADADPALLAQAQQLLAELDRELGRVVVTVDPPDAELRLGEGRWEPAQAVSAWRAVPGPVVIAARHADRQTTDATVTVVRGGQVSVTLRLPALAPAPPVGATFGDRSAPDDRGRADAAAAPGRLGAAAKVVIDGRGRGAGAVLGGVLGLGPASLDLAAIVGPTFGAYAGARLAVGHGRFRPLVSAGLPLFFDDGPRLSARGAGGLEYRVTPRLRMSVELGVEYQIMRAADIERWLLAPAVAAEARL
ncbi:MAG: hypothetical protein R3B06_26625 [Kofleriaceae bacterium]